MHGHAAPVSSGGLDVARALRLALVDFGALLEGLSGLPIAGLRGDHVAGIDTVQCNG